MQDDSLLLEDESGRIKLLGLEAVVPLFVTGIVIAVRGRVTEKGAFQV